MIEVQGHENNRRVCATRFIPKGRRICRFTGDPITYAQTLELGRHESYALQTDTNLYLLLHEPYRYFNHSCRPNCGLTPELWLVALQNITEGHELRYDYSTTMLERHWQMPCRCNAINCRKTIRDFDTLPQNLQNKYLGQGIVQAFIVRTLKHRHTRHRPL